MRHRVAGKKLARSRSHRKALFRNLISALILHGKIETTESKAKATRRLFDRLVSKGKVGTLHARRVIAAFLNNQKAVNKLVNKIVPKFKNRPGGFTRMVRLGKRRGDDAIMVKLELIEKPEAKEKDKKNEKNKSNQSK